MNWLRKIASVLVITNMVLAPAFTQAQSAPKTPPQADNQNNKPKDYQIVFDKDGKEAFLFEKGNPQPVVSFPLRSKEQLRKYSPKILNARLKAELENFNKTKGASYTASESETGNYPQQAPTANGRKKRGFLGNVKDASGQAWSHSLRNLPAESAIFGIAMGASVATQLFANYSQNPMAMKQHLEHQVSPIGIASFYTFMYTQGVTSNVLSMYLTNPAYRHMIPYLGMAVGAFVQSYLSQVLSDPNVMACGKVMLGGTITPKDLEAGVDSDPCTKAHEYLIVNRKIWEFAPGIISMLGSSAIAGTIQGVGGKVVQAGANAAAKFIPRITGFDIVTMLIPGGMEIKGIRLLLVKGLQIYLFVTIDHFLSTAVNFVWKNTWDGAEFHQLNDRLVDATFAQKKSNWSADNKDLLANVKRLHKKSSEWRMMNLGGVYEAHQNWSESLEQLTAMFNASYSFYSAFTNEARNSQKNARGLLNRSYPLNGVIAKDLVEGKEDLYFTNPDFVESMQLDTVTDVVAYIDQSVQDQTYKNQNWMPAEEAALKQIRDQLANDDIMVKGQGLVQLNKEIEKSIANNITPEFLWELQKIYTKLGNPQPMLETGRGFLATYEAAPSNSQTVSAVAPQYVNGIFKTNHLTDYLLMQMACGPDAERGEASIRQAAGFPSIFAPPQLKNPADDFNQSCYMSGELDTPMIYTWDVQASNGQKYKGFLDYLKVNIRPSVLGGETSNFPDWWKKTTESQMQAAFEQYQKDYSKIVADLITGIFHSETKPDSEKSGLEKTTSYLKSFFTVEDSAYNIGPMSNTATISLYQEARTYQMLLGEMLKDVYKAQKKSTIPAEYLSPQMEQAPQFTADEASQKFYRHLPLIAMLGRSSTLEFDRLVQPFVSYPNVSTAAKPTGYRLKIQDDLEKEMNALYDMLKQIKVVTITETDASTGTRTWFGGVKSPETFTAIQSPIENDQLEDQLTKIQSALSRFKNLLGANQTPSSDPATQLLTEGQPAPSVSEKLARAKEDAQALMMLVTAGPEGKAQNREVWNQAIALSLEAIDAMKDVAIQSPEEAPAFNVDTQIKATREAILGLGNLINKTERSRTFPTNWQHQLAAVRVSLKALLAGLDNGVKATTAIVELTDAQKELAKTCIENLQSIAMEMKMYGSIANAVDWAKLRNLKQLNSQQQAFENETQKKLKQIRAAGIGLGARN